MQEVLKRNGPVDQTLEEYKSRKSRKDPEPEAVAKEAAPAKKKKAPAKKKKAPAKRKR